jgi:hypothetical protein
MTLETPEKIDPKHTEANPDLKGFDLAAMAGLGAYHDGSGGGIRNLAWELAKLRELRERIALLDAFVLKHQMLLARLSWSLDDTVIHPTKKQGEEKDIGVFVPQIELCSYAFDKRKHGEVKAHDIAALWPDATWRRSMPRWGDSETERDYTADVDGVCIRIKNAERKPKPKPVDAFGPCGRVRIPNDEMRDRHPSKSADNKKDHQNES